MNVIFILCDTLTRDKISPYHQGEGKYGYIKTPNLDRLADKSVTFDNYWLNSAPCMPARRDLFSGRIEFPWRSWGPRESFDPDWTLALNDTDVTTCLFTNHANLFDVGSGNYHHFFDSYYFVRGHYNDHCATGDPENAGDPRQIYLEATKDMDSEEKTFVARNMNNIINWLDENADSHKPFFLFVDEFDPHWPLDPPEPYRSMYLNDKSLVNKNLSIFYKSGQAEDYTPEELAWIQAQYAGKLTMVDHWLGKVFDRLDQHNLWDDTLVILTTDHGEFTGEYGQVSKGSGFSYPLFARNPLLIHDPQSSLNGTRIDELTCAVDLNATVLDGFGIKPEDSVHGQSLLPLLRQQDYKKRNSVIYGWWGKGFYWTDGRYLLCKAPEKEGPLNQYGTNLGEKYVGLAGEYFDRYNNAEVGKFMPHTERPVYRVPSDGMAYSNNGADFNGLYDMKNDPQCLDNIFYTNQELRKKCCKQLFKAMQRLEVPEEHYQRLGLQEEVND